MRFKLLLFKKVKKFKKFKKLFKVFKLLVGVAASATGVSVSHDVRLLVVVLSEQGREPEQPACVQPRGAAWLLEHSAAT